MTYISKPLVSFADSPNLDSFDRLRISNPYTIFDSKQLYDGVPLFWDDIQISGSGTTSVYNTNQASTTLAVSNTTEGHRARQTRRRFNYQPGKSSLIFMTGILGNPVAGITKRLGIFDDENGLFFESKNSSVSVGIRSFTSGSAVDTVIPQSSWNFDKMDGTGKSGVTLDFTKTQIFIIDYEWLGVGRVRYGFVIDGQIIYCHAESHANALDVVYMSTPNLPLRYEISNDGTGAISEITHICTTVISEGGIENNGYDVSIDRGVTPLTTPNNNTTIYPLVAIRLKDNFKNSTVYLNNINVMCADTATYKWSIILNPTIAGTPFVWSNIPKSSLSASTTATSATTIVPNTGIVLDSGYSKSTDTSQNNTGGFDKRIPNQLTLGYGLTGDADYIVLAVQNVVAGANNYYGAVSWREIF